jgi:outer membrane protein OmpA-like peptidoglycan-associated protein
MLSLIDSKKKVAVFVLMASLPLLQGCIATRPWVREQVNPATERLTKLEGQVNQIETRLPVVESRLATTENRITEVSTKTGGADAKASQALTNISNLRFERRLELRLDDGVSYRPNSSALTKQAKQNIDAFLSDIRRDVKEPQVFVVGGHTDSRGTDRQNYDLARKRAQGVAEYLILQKKIDPMKVVTVSFGESSPLAANNIRAGREKNRRVEIRVYSEVVTTGAGTPVAQR